MRATGHAWIPEAISSASQSPKSSINVLAWARASEVTCRRSKPVRATEAGATQSSEWALTGMPRPGLIGLSAVESSIRPRAWLNEAWLRPDYKVTSDLLHMPYPIF